MNVWKFMKKLRVCWDTVNSRQNLVLQLDIPSFWSNIYFLENIFSGNRNSYCQKAV